MRVVKLKGGLGNQMFQYAYAKLVEEMTGDTVKLDFSAFAALRHDEVRVPRLARFSLSLDAADEKELKSICMLPHGGNSQTLGYRLGILMEKTLNRRYFFEPNRAYIAPETIRHHAYFDGYWQSYRYVDRVLDAIKVDFRPLKALSERTQAARSIMQAQNAVFVGVRRGDYAAEAAHYGSFSEKYYRAAMARIAEQVKSPVFYVFSNDIEWCRENLRWDDYNVVFRSKEQQTDDFEELLLMASCKHAIIVNSTFNWWGAYLIENPEKIIICPQNCFFDDQPIDIIPPQWTRIKEQ